MAESRPGWVNGMNQDDARLATGLLVTSATGEGDSGAARTGMRPAPGEPGRVTPSDGDGGSGLVTVAPFQAVLELPDTGGPFLVTLENNKDLDVFGGAQPPETDPRIDLVTARVTGVEDRRFEVTVRHGDAAPDPRPPEPEPGALPLAEITIAPEATGIGPDDITPRWREHPFTCAVGGVLPVRGADARPGNAYEGMYVHRLDTGDLECLHDGTWVTYRRHRDTGWITVENLGEDYVHGDAGELAVRRIGETVHMRGSVQKTVDEGRPDITDLTSINTLRVEDGPGFRPDAQYHALLHTPRSPRRLYILPSGEVRGARLSGIDVDGERQTPLPAGRDQYVHVSWLTDDPWPDVSPGPKPPPPGAPDFPGPYGGPDHW
ncbi:hypothetical protein FHX37_3603 [Haloactinospora alba]|uniref:Uncharacterized protein n=1 Tax=Haloactinospora alba TaxID=405555 RepID=A0A543N8Y0_9ACTN|nr:hypothetical protein [Haloactinospora alba]TQN28270.1 hypothetical protein FHX37_3603 [Haloactinospora alba]